MLLSKWWRKRQRQIDLKILWPSILDQAKDLDHAKQAFRFHAFRDKAWDGIPWPEIESMLDAETPCGVREQMTSSR